MSDILRPIRSANISKQSVLKFEPHPDWNLGHSFSGLGIDILRHPTSPPGGSQKLFIGKKIRGKSLKNSTPHKCRPLVVLVSRNSCGE